MIEQENLDYLTQLLKNNPASKAFAPLAEGYRKIGELKKALQIARNGMAVHPKFNSGKVALARILIDLKKYNAAEKILLEVTLNDFENLLAHRSLGEIYIHTNDLSKALNAFKSALLANPLDKTSSTMVAKLESISAKSFDAETFKHLPAHESAEQKIIHKKNLSLHSALSYIDALIIRNNYNSARKHTSEYLLKFPRNPDLLKRKSYLKNLKNYNPTISRTEALSKPEITKQKLKALYEAIECINEQIQTRPELIKG